MYCECADRPDVIAQSIFTRIIKCLRRPLSLKYGCPYQSTWILASRNFIQALSVGVPVHKKISKKEKELWDEIADTFQDFLFSKQPLPAQMTTETFSNNQALDCQMVYLLRDLFLNDASRLPDAFLGRLIGLLSIGATQGSGIEDIVNEAKKNSSEACHNGLASILMTRELSVNSAFGIDVPHNQLRSYKHRDTLAKVCFETVLAYALGGLYAGCKAGDNSLMGIFQKSNIGSGLGLPEPSVSVSRMAVRSIMSRCLVIVKEFNETSRQNIKVPMSRPTVTELQFVFRATLSVLVAVESLSTNSNPVDEELYQIMSHLYTQFVDCLLVASDSPFLLQSLHTVLRQYASFISPILGKNTEKVEDNDCEDP
ncbi:Endocytosis and vacuole integrity protein [Cichlidogyrus casuarinus]|uniref:Endocytosis and vacuole integrity protein n=1 Tax=Cichlidogyrus casuarinus TaxID=1844966 RepID=A0ABD2QNM1_9PLAT